MSKTLEDLRKEIDVLDEEIVERLAKRIKVSKEIGELKKVQHVDAFVKDRWQKVLESKIELGKKLGVSKDFIETVYNAIHDHSVKVQKDLGATGKR
jgi:chorismate mutase